MLTPWGSVLIAVLSVVMIFFGSRAMATQRYVGRYGKILKGADASAMGCLISGMGVLGLVGWGIFALIHHFK